MAGCSSVHTKTAKVQYAPQRQGGLASIKPKTIAIRVNDERPVEERDCVLRYRASSIDPTWVFVTKQPVPDLVREAVKKEFELNGHRVVSDPNVKPDASITVGLKRLFATVVLGARSMVADVNADIAIARTGGSPPPDPIFVSGNFKKTYNAIFAVISADPSNELSGALAEFIHNLTLESRLLDALQ